MNHFSVITITHKTANINHIGKYLPSVSDNPSELAKTLEQIKSDLGISELMYLATCNRLTFFMVQDNTTIDRAYLLRFFAHLHPNIPEHCLSEMADLVSIYTGTHAVKHIFEVATSLDSLVIGEREILRQIKDAYDYCNTHHLTGDSIRLAIKTAIPLAKDIYTRTRIGENSISVVSLAMQQLQELNPDINARFILVGAGQTNTLVAKFLIKQGFKHFAVFNRTLSTAQHLAHKLKGTAYPLTGLETYTEGFDVLISCTGAKDAIITEPIYRQLIGGDTSKKIIVDLAVPSDVAITIQRKYPICYIEVEKLRELAEVNLNLRKEEMVHAQQMVDEKLAEFKLLIRQRRVERAMSVIPEQIKEVKERAFNSVFQKEIAEMDEKSQALLQKVVGYLEQKYIGIPIKLAKNVLADELAATEAL